MRYEADCVAQDGREFVLLQDAYLAGTGRGHYEASAFCPDDVADECGYIPVYRVVWEILDEYDPECGDEDGACDWGAVDDYYVVNDMPATDKAEYMA